MSKRTLASLDMTTEIYSPPKWTSLPTRAQYLRGVGRRLTDQSTENSSSLYLKKIEDFQSTRSLPCDLAHHIPWSSTKYRRIGTRIQLVGLLQTTYQLKPGLFVQSHHISSPARYEYLPTRIVLSCVQHICVDVRNVDLNNHPPKFFAIFRLSRCGFARIYKRDVGRRQDGHWVLSRNTFRSGHGKTWPTDTHSDFHEHPSDDVAQANEL